LQSIALDRDGLKLSTIGFAGHILCLELMSYQLYLSMKVILFVTYSRFLIEKRKKSFESH
jgi:hypothetical protein